MKSNSIYEILTPSGFECFSNIKKTSKSKYIEFKFSNGSLRKCSFNHIFLKDKKLIYAIDIKIGDFIDGKDSTIEVLNKKIINEQIDLFDIMNVANGNLFFIDENIISHNCDANFLSSGANVVNPILIKQYENSFVRNPILKKGPGNNLWIWELPIPGEEYIIPADVARGDGSDYSACHVMSKENAEQVAEFKMQLGTREYANFLFNLGIEYNNALLVVENASMGWDVVQELINLGYPNLYYSNPALLFTSTNNTFIPFDGSAKLVPGFTNSSKTRPMIIAKLETYFGEQACIFHSERLLTELNVFIWYKGKAQSQPGFNDDLVISWATGLFIRDTFSKLHHNSLQLTETLIDQIGSAVSSGIHERERNRIIQDNFTISDGKQGTESLDWLLDNKTKIKVDNPVERKKDDYLDRLIWLG